MILNDEFKVYNSYLALYSLNTSIVSSQSTIHEEHQLDVYNILSWAGDHSVKYKGAGTGRRQSKINTMQN